MKKEDYCLRGATSDRADSLRRELAMNFEFDWITGVTLLVTAANAIAVIIMMTHGIYVRRKQMSRRKSANVRRRNSEGFFESEPLMGE